MDVDAISSMTGRCPTYNKNEQLGLHCFNCNCRGHVQRECMLPCRNKGKQPEHLPMSMYMNAHVAPLLPPAVLQFPPTPTSFYTPPPLSYAPSVAPSSYAPPASSISFQQ